MLTWILHHQKAYPSASQQETDGALKLDDGGEFNESTVLKYVGRVEGKPQVILCTTALGLRRPSTETLEKAERLAVWEAAAEQEF